MSITCPNCEIEMRLHMEYMFEDDHIEQFRCMNIACVGHDKSHSYSFILLKNKNEILSYRFTTIYTDGLIYAVRCDIGSQLATTLRKDKEMVCIAKKPYKLFLDKSLGIQINSHIKKLLKLSSFKN